MAHIIGYTGTVNTDELETYNKGKKEEDKDYYSSDETVGKAGIEKQFEKYLHGDSGSKALLSIMWKNRRNYEDSEIRTGIILHYL